MTQGWTPEERAKIERVLEIAEAFADEETNDQETVQEARELLLGS